jgi:hypothetical protein
MRHQAERQEVGKDPTPCDVARNTMDNHGTGAGIVSVAMTGHHRRQNGPEPLSEALLTSAQVTRRFPALLM